MSIKITDVIDSALTIKETRTYAAGLLRTKVTETPPDSQIRLTGRTTYQYTAAGLLSVVGDVFSFPPSHYEGLIMWADG